MTVHPTSGHLDLDALADVLAGERGGERHLRACASCRERLTELAAAEVAVAADLATLPSPPLPDGLSERLAGALRDEAARGADRGAGRGAGSRRAAPVVPLRRRRSAAPWLPAAAAAVALVLAGGFGLRALQGGLGQSSDAGPTAAGGAASESASGSAGSSTSAPGTVDYADESVRSSAVADLLAGAAGAAPVEPAVPARSGAPSGDTDTGTDTDADADGAAPAPALVAPGSDPVLDRLRDPAALAECLTALRRDGSPAAAPLAVDFAAYDGAPALAVVQPDADPATLVLTVVGPGCSGADPDTRLRTRVPRP